MHFHRLIPFLAAFNRSFSSHGKTPEEARLFKQFINIISNTVTGLEGIPSDVPIYKLIPIEQSELKEIGKSIPIKNVVAIPLRKKKSKRRDAK